MTEWRPEGRDARRRLLVALIALACVVGGPGAASAAAKLINGFPPEVVGNPAIGERLVCGAGSWNGIPEFTYKWIREGTQVAEGVTYFVRTEDKGYSLWCVVKATVREFEGTTETVEARSINSLRIPGERPTPPESTEAPTVSGRAAVNEILSCSQGRWSGNPKPTFTYQWVRDPGSEETSIEAATAPTYKVASADQGHSLACRVTAQNSLGSASRLSSNSLAIAGIPPVRTAPPEVLGVEPASVGETLTCSSGEWSGSPKPTFKYRWQRDGVLIAGATSTVYTVEAADQLHALSCTVIATNSAGSTEASSANAVNVRGSKPQNISQPTLGGTAAVGSSLTCEHGSWSGVPSPEYSYQWFRESQEITAATSSVYLITSADRGKALSCRVTATNREGEASRFSQSVVVPIEAPEGRPPVNQHPPSVSGTEAVGGTLSCSEGAWSGNPVPVLGYEWLRDGAAIVAETANTHVVVQADAGHQLSCRVTAVNNEGIAESESNRVSIPGIPPEQLPHQEPSTIGTPAVGELLTCLKGGWSGAPAPSLSVQWLREGSAIGGATGATYTVTGEDRGAFISCRVTAHNVAGTAQATSNGLRIPGNGPKPVAPPEVLGAPAVGNTLTCAPGTWNAQPAPGFSFQWRRAGAAIPSATQSAYTVVAADMGLDLSCKVIATNREGTGSALSSPVHVPGLAPEDTEAPHVTGAPAVGQQLTCQRGSWRGTPPPAFTYQWLRDGASVASATASTYTVELADEGHTLACTVIASNSEGSVEAQSSNSLGVPRPPIPDESRPESTPLLLSPPVATSAQILTALRVQLARMQHHVHLASLRKRGSYSFSFFAPAAGKLEVFWYEPVKGAHRSASAKPVVLALAITTFSGAGTRTVKLVLTAVARRMIRSSSRIPLSIKAAFAPPRETPVTWTASYLLSH
jgi:hypothetical protein